MQPATPDKLKRSYLPDSSEDEGSPKKSPGKRQLARAFVGSPEKKALPQLPHSPHKFSAIRKRLFEDDSPSEKSVEGSKFLRPLPTFEEAYRKKILSTLPRHLIETPEKRRELFDNVCKLHRHYELGIDKDQSERYFVILHADTGINDTHFDGWTFTESTMCLKYNLHHLLSLNNPKFNSAKTTLVKFCSILDDLHKKAVEIAGLKTLDDMKKWSKRKLAEIWSLKAGQSYFIPTGWDGKTSGMGHVMVDEYIASKVKTLELVNYTSGAGCENNLIHVVDNKIKAVRYAGFPTLTRKELFFSDALADADATMLQAKVEMQHSKFTPQRTFNANDTYLRAQHHIRDKFQAMEGPIRTEQRGGTCCLKVLFAILDKRLNDGKFYKYCKFQLKLSTLTSYYLTYKKNTGSPAAERIRAELLNASYKFLKSAKKLDEAGIISEEESLIAYALGSTLVEEFEAVLNEEEKNRSSLSEKLDFNVKPDLALQNIHLADYAISDVAAEPSTSEPAPFITTRPAPENLAEFLKKIATDIGSLDGVSIRSAKIKADLDRIELLMSSIPIPSGEDAAYWKNIPDKDIHKCIEGFSSLIDTYALLRYSYYLPGLTKHEKLQDRFAVREAHSRNMALQFIVTLHALGLRQDEIWIKSLPKNVTYPQLSAYPIKIPRTGNEQDPGTPLMSDKFDLFFTHEDIQNQLRIFHYFNEWNKGAPENECLFDVWSDCYRSLDKHKAWANVPDYQYFKTLISVIPNLSKTVRSNRRILPQRFNYPEDKLLPIELMMDTGNSCVIPADMGDSSKKMIVSPLEEIHAGHIVALRKSYVFYALMQQGNVLKDDLSYRPVKLSILSHERNLLLFGYGAIFNQYHVDKTTPVFTLPTVNRKFFENSRLNDRFFTAKELSEAEESREYVSYSTSNKGKTSNLENLYRCWMCPNLLPIYILDHYQTIYDELADPVVQKEFDNLIFKAVTIRDGEKVDVTHPFFKLLNENPRLIGRLKDFINEGIHHFLNKNPLTFNADGPLFLVKFSYLIKTSGNIQKSTELIKEELSTLQEINIRSKGETTTGIIAFYTCLSMMMSLSPTWADIHTLTENYILLDCFDIPKRFKSIALENAMKKELLKYLPHMKVFLKSPEGDSIFPSLLAALNFQENAKVLKGVEVISIVDDTQTLTIDLTTLKISFTKGSHKHPAWEQEEFRPLFNFKRYPAIQNESSLSFEHPIFGKMRFVVNPEQLGRFSLQCEFDGTWYTYVSPIIGKTILDLLPAGLWINHSLWVDSKGNALIVENSTNRKWTLVKDGVLNGAGTIISASYYVNHSTLYSNLSSFETPELTLVYRNERHEISKIDFIQCRTLNKKELCFERDRSGNLLWVQNNQYRLAPTKKMGLLGTIDSYLYLESTDGNKAKVLVTLQNHNAKHPDEDFSKKASLTIKPTMSMMSWIMADKLKATTYFEFDVVKGKLIPASKGAEYYLIFLYMIQKNYVGAFSILKKINAVKKIDEQELHLIKEMLDYSNFSEPNLYAVKVHLIVILLENYERSIINLENERNTLFVENYSEYLELLNNIHPDYLLKKEAELFLLNYLIWQKFKDDTNELLERRKATLEGTLTTKFKEFKPKLSDVLEMSFGEVLKPFTVENIETIPRNLIKYVTPKTTLFDPDELFSNFYYWYSVALDTNPINSEKKRLLKLKLALLTRSAEETTQFSQNFKMSVMEYLRVALLMPGQFPKCPSTILEARNMLLWFRKVHDCYQNASKLLIKSDAVGEIKETDDEVFIPRTDNFTPQKIRAQIPRIIDLQEYTLDDVMEHFEIPNISPKEAPKIFEFDLNELTEEQLPYQGAIKEEFRKFKEEFEAGFNQNHNSRKYLLKGSFPDLVAKLQNKRNQFKEHFEQLKQSAITYALNPPTEANRHLRHLLMEKGQGTKEITFEKLAGCLLTNDWSLVKKRSPQFTDRYIAVIEQMTLQAIWSGVSLQCMERCLQISQDTNLDPVAAVQKIGEDLYKRRTYPIQLHPSILVQEYLRGIKLRTYQGEFLTAALNNKPRYASGVFQVPPGGGKSSELGPQMSFQAADGKRLSLFLALPSQYDALVDLFTKNQMECFEQEVDAISLTIDQMNPDKMRTLFSMLSQAIIRKRMVLMPSDLPSILYVHWIELMAKESLTFDASKIDENNLTPTQKEIIYLKDINKIFKKLTDAIGDEADLLLSIMHEINIIFGSLEKAPPMWLNLVSDIYRIMTLHPDISEKVGFENNNHSFMTPEYYNKIVKPGVVEVLLKSNMGNIVPAMFHKACKDYLLEKIDPRLEEFIESAERPKLDIINQNNLDFLQWLKKQDQVLYSEGSTVADYIALTKHLLNDVISHTINKSANRHYGWVKNNTAIGPHKASNSPSNNNFGYIFEELAYYMQTGATLSIPYGYFENYVLTQIKLAENIAHAANTTVEETQIGKNLSELLDTELCDIYSDNLHEIYEKINQDPEKRLAFVHELANSNVKYQTTVISSDAIKQARRYNTLRVMTATPYNVASFDSSISANFHVSLGTDGQIVEAIFRHDKELERNSIHLVSDPDPRVILRELKAKHPEFDRIQGIDDGVGMFSKFTQKENVDLIVKFFALELKQNQPGSESHKRVIKAVFSFLQPVGSTAATIPALFMVESNTIHMLDGTLEKDFKKYGLNLNDIFYFVPEIQTTGMHVDKPENCISLNTLDPNNIQRTFCQTATRSRKLLEGQRVEFLMLKSAAIQYPQLRSSLYPNIRRNIINQGIKISREVLRTYSKAPIKEASVLADDKIITEGNTFTEIMTIFMTYKDALMTSTRIKPYQMFGALSRKENPLASISRDIKATKNKYGETLTSLNNNLDALYAKASKDPYLPSENKRNSSQMMGLETQNQTQVATQTQQQNEIKAEIQLYQSYSEEEAFHKEIEWDNTHILSLILHDENTQYPVQIFGLKSILEQTQEFYADEYSEIFFDDIMATENFIFTYQTLRPIFHRHQKLGKQILIRQDPVTNELSAVFLSLREVDKFAEELKAHFENDLSVKTFLITPDGKQIVDNPKFAPPSLEGEYLRLLIQINFFNGNLEFLEQHKEEALEWMIETETKLKMRFLRVRTAHSPYLTQLLENGSFKNL